MRTHFDVINDFMMVKWEGPIRFVGFLVNPFYHTYFINEFSLYVCYILSIIFFVFQSLHFSASTANMLFYQLYLMILRLRLDCKKKLSVDEQRTS